MQWNPAILEKFIAPSVGAFTSAEIPDLAPKFPEAPHWIANHFINNALRSHFKDEYRPAVLGYLRRAQNAFLAYHDARGQTIAYLAGNDPLNPRVRKYFDAISRWEDFCLQVSMTIDIFKWLNGGEGAFKKGDGSKEQRLYQMANQIKHLSSAIESGQCKPEHTVPVWLGNDGLKSFELQVTFDEAAAVLGDIALLADEYEDALGFKERRKGMSV